jgi:hypothetical protein
MGLKMFCTIAAPQAGWISAVRLTGKAPALRACITSYRPVVRRQNMNRFQLPKDLTYNRGAIHDPTAYAKETACASWLFLVGEEIRFHAGRDVLGSGAAVGAFLFPRHQQSARGARSGSRSAARGRASNNCPARL